MAITPAEKQRRYREKRDNDLERRSSYLAKQTNKYIKEKETGKRKLIGDMSVGEKRSQRKYWKNSKRMISTILVCSTNRNRQRYMLL